MATHYQTFAVTGQSSTQLVLSHSSALTLLLADSGLGTSCAYDLAGGAWLAYEPTPNAGWSLASWFDGGIVPVPQAEGLLAKPTGFRDPQGNAYAIYGDSGERMLALLEGASVQDLIGPALEISVEPTPSDPDAVWVMWTDLAGMSFAARLQGGVMDAPLAAGNHAVTWLGDYVLASSFDLAATV